MACSGKALAMNAEALDGEIRAELLDDTGSVIEGYELGSCTSFTGDSLAAELVWKDRSLEPLLGKAIKIRFHLEKASLYAFWFK